MSIPPGRPKECSPSLGEDVAQRQEGRLVCIPPGRPKECSPSPGGEAGVSRSRAPCLRNGPSVPDRHWPVSRSDRRVWQ